MPIERSYRDEIGREREYEMIFILTPDVPQNRLKEIITKISKFVEDSEGGKIILLETWGKRKLAYPIKKRREGIYYYWRMLGHGKMIAEIEKYLRMSEFVLRFFALKLEDNVDPNSRPSDVTPEVIQQASDLNFINKQVVTEDVEQPIENIEETEVSKEVKTATEEKAPEGEGKNEED